MLPVVNVNAIFSVKNRCEPLAVTFDNPPLPFVVCAHVATLLESTVTVYPPRA